MFKERISTSYFNKQLENWYVAVSNRRLGPGHISAYNEEVKNRVVTYVNVKFLGPINIMSLVQCAKVRSVSDPLTLKIPVDV